MAYTVPCDPTLTHYDMQITLDEVTYTLEFRWNNRAGAWMMHITTEGGEPILMGTRIVIDMPLGKRSTDARMPKGVFIAVDTSERKQDPGMSDLGDRVQLLYFTASELPITEV